MTDLPSKRLKPSPVKTGSSLHSVVQDYFGGIKAFIVENGLGKTRAKILVQKLEKHGGEHHKKLKFDTTHIVVAQNVRYERIAKLVGLGDKAIPDGLVIVRADWLSRCLAEGQVVCLQNFIVSSPSVEVKDEHVQKSQLVVPVGFEEDNACHSQSNQCPGNKSDSDDEPSTLENQEVEVAKDKPLQILSKADSDSDFIDSGDEKSSLDVNKSSHITSKCSPEKTKGHWVCAAPSTSKGANLNQHITDKLQVLATSYANTKDQWRALGYKKAIASIKIYHKRIETREECSNIPFVGEKLARKIWEIVETGHLQRLDHMDPKMEVINLFSDVWGAGPKTAEIWASQGLKTLQDLEENGNLTRQQQIGLKHFEEFRERMPREEAGKIGEQVLISASEVNKGLVCEICGSYRRGKITCGDVDVLISHSDGKSHHGVLPMILENLKLKGFLTDDLVSIHSEHSKYMGVCRLPGEDSKHRRLDIIMVPYDEWACAIMYFTGSDYFNRSMRLLAKKNGMSLSERSLNSGVVRHGGEKVFEGTPLPVCSERDVFKYLGLEYREPQERDW